MTINFGNNINYCHKVFAIITGAIFPILFIVFGDITDVLTQKEAMPNMSDDIFMDGIIQVAACQDYSILSKAPHIAVCNQYFTGRDSLFFTS